MSLRDDRKPMRLQAYLASAGIGSRRHCESFILDGRVQVNGVQAQLGQSVQAGDVVFFDGKPVLPQARKRYLMLNKPAGYLCAMSDPRGRSLAVDLLKDEVDERVYNIGRLDQWSSGLLLFTNDGDFARRMSHPSGNMEKEYELITDDSIPASFPADFEAGLMVDGLFYKARSVKIFGQRSASIILIEGRNREIRRVLAHYRLRALSLRRIRIGSLLLGTLAEGRYRELTAAEVEELSQALAN